MSYLTHPVLVSQASSRPDELHMREIQRVIGMR